MRHLTFIELELLKLQQEILILFRYFSLVYKITSKIPSVVWGLKRT